MTNWYASVERAQDGSWTASLLGSEHVVLGTGGTKVEALEDLKLGISSLAEYLREQGAVLDAPEVMSIAI